MKNNAPFSFAQRLRSFKYAFAGLWLLLRSEHNARLHVVAALLAILFGFYFNISATEWIAIVFCIAAVLALEAANSAIEALADFVSPDKHESIKKTKDLAAAAVLLFAIGAAVIGAIIFLPKMYLALR
jgi:diacylglycerol kinase (ATP)